MRRVLALSRSLRGASFRQRLGMYIEPLRALGYEVTPFEYRGAWRRLRKLGQRDFDLLWVVRGLMDPLTAAIVGRLPVPSVLDIDDAVMMSSSVEQEFSSRERTRARRFARTAATVDAVVVGNDYLATEARRWNPQVKVLPTGVDLERYRQQQRTSEESAGEVVDSERAIRLVWIGSKATFRFLVERRELFRVLAKRFPEVKLRIICDRFPDWDDIPLERVEWSPSSEVESLATADIGVAPLPDTPYTRGKCGYKLVQYMASGLPFVASPVGCHTTMVEHGTAGFLAQDDAEWLECVARLIRNAALRAEMGQRGQEWVQASYDLAVLAPRWASIFDRLIAGEAAAAVGDDQLAKGRRQRRDLLKSGRLSHRADIINYFVRTRRYASYLEIGTSKGRNLSRVRCARRVGVDPRPRGQVKGATLRALESDAFFRDNTETFDLIFIDGLHLSEQVYRDVLNALAILRPGGLILLHDCHPATEEAQERDEALVATGAWNGDVWKTVAYLRQHAPELFCQVIDVDHGIGVVRPRRNVALEEHRARESDAARFFDALRWSDLVERREELLGLVGGVAELEADLSADEANLE